MGISKFRVCHRPVRVAILWALVAAGAAAAEQPCAWAQIAPGSAEVRMTIRSLVRGHPSSFLFPDDDPRREEIWHSLLCLEGKVAWRSDPNRFVFEIQVQNATRTAQPAENAAWLKKWEPFSAEITMCKDRLRPPSGVLVGEGLDASEKNALYAGQVVMVVETWIAMVVCPTLYGNPGVSEDGKGVSVTVAYPQRMMWRVSNTQYPPVHFGAATPERFQKLPVICEGVRTGWRLEALSVKQTKAQYHGRFIDAQTGMVTHAVHVDVRPSDRGKSASEIADLIGLWSPEESAPYDQYMCIETELTPAGKRR